MYNCIPQVPQAVIFHSRKQNAVVLFVCEGCSLEHKLIWLEEHQFETSSCIILRNAKCKTRDDAPSCAHAALSASSAFRAYGLSLASDAFVGYGTYETAVFDCGPPAAPDDSPHASRSETADNAHARKGLADAHATEDLRGPATCHGPAANHHEAVCAKSRESVSAAGGAKEPRHGGEI